MKEQSIISYISNSDINTDSPLGAALAKAANEANIMSSKTEEDPLAEIRGKMKAMKEAEDSNNLLRIPYDSFNSLPIPVQESIRMLDPLFWSGVYIRYSDFLSKEREILCNLDNTSCVVIFKESGVFNFLNLIDHSIPWLKEFERKIAVRQDKIRKTLRRYYVKEGTLIVDDYTTK